MALIAQDLKLWFPPIQLRIRGVFKGGGAKGIVYCGALYELRARGIWFESVAGSSAGAITAALIAAGYSPTELVNLVGSGLASVKRNLFTWLANADRAYFKTAELHDWLEDALCSRVDLKSRNQPLTFAELNSLGPGIELNVVAMDLARSEPIVFSAHLTPDCSVSAAVVASSAIPLAMPARRVRITTEDGKTYIQIAPRDVVYES